MKTTSLIVTACITLISLAVPAQIRAAGDVIHTNKPQFRIPFRFDAAEIERLHAQEVQLFLSMDRGATWQQVQSASPSAQRFEFDAPHDGEYWFDVQTMDEFNRLHPGGDTFQAGLKVVVDREAPVLSLRLTQLEDNRVGLEWRTEDTHADAATLVLEYMDPGSDVWQAMGVRPAVSGKTTWTVRQDGMASVRGRISDRANNVGSREERITVRFSPGAGDVNAGNNPFAAPQYPKNQASPVQQYAPVGPFAERPRYTTTDATPAVPRVRPRDPNGAPPQEPALAQNSTWNYADAHPSDSSTARPYDPPGATYTDDPAYRTSPVQGNTGDWKQESNLGATRRRVVASTRFQLDYKLDDVGPSGIGMVELFITENESGKWFRYGEDADKRSPFQIEVPGEGTYGFSVRARSGAGLSMAPPRPGEIPDVVVTVDRTAPVVRLNPVRTSSDGMRNVATLSWTISDSNAHSRPVSLQYAPSPGGPWEAITDWHADQGSFDWTLSPELPARLYFRITARDLAGNVAADETREPLLIDFSRPRARIVDIEAINVR